MKIDAYTAFGVHRERNESIPAAEGRVGGVKYMERVEKGEKVNLFRELGESAVVELSDTGVEELNKKLQEIKGNGLPVLSRQEQEKLLQESIKPARKLHRIIPNIQTNDQLTKSLQGADEEIIDEAYSIIDNYLLPHNVGDMTEDERRELIREGVREAEKLAESLEEGKAASFLDAMRTIAKYGVNGQMDDQGNVVYDIQWGPMVGAPDDYISSGELMKRIAPEQYREFSAMMEAGAQKKDDRMIMKAVVFAMNWEINANRNTPELIQREKEKQVLWKRQIDSTVI